jgi:hypothetical protein
MRGNGMQIAHLWRRRAGEWEPKVLGAEAFCFASWDAPAATAWARAADFDCRVIRAGDAALPIWALVAAPGACVQVNGRAPLGGLQVLNDRDSIRDAEGARYYFSTESLPVVEPFPAGDRPVICGRCRLRLEPSSPAVRCPACSIWYHQGGDLPCWTYDERCAYCGARTALEAGGQWTPEG